MAEQIIKQYSEEEMELFKNILENATKRSKPKFYEILVDGLKAVERTSDVEDFDTYLNFVKENSRQIEVRMFYSANSPKFEKHSLLIGAAPIETKSMELSGIEIQNRITQGIQAEREKWEKEDLKKQLQEEKDSYADLEKYVADLETQITQLRSAKNTLGGFDMGELAGSALTAFLKNNVHAIEKLTGAKGLAGAVLSENNSTPIATSNHSSEVEFSENNSAVTLSEDDQQSLLFVNHLKGKFDEINWKKVMEIVQQLGTYPAKIDTIHELLQTTKN
jgi:hypothetical protein